MKHFTAAAFIAALTLPACAPVVPGGPTEPLRMSPYAMETSRVGTITLSSEWLRANDEFSDTFVDEIREELNGCATGETPLNLRIHVDELHRNSRLASVLTGRGAHTLAATAEFVDPARGNAVVGRFPIEVAIPSGGGLPALFGDRQMIASEAWGRALCTEAFGRNPRRPGPHNATPG